MSSAAPESPGLVEPELMTAGPSHPNADRRALLILALVVLLAAGGFGGWRWYVDATDLVTKAELQASYDTMINSDGRTSTGQLGPHAAGSGSDSSTDPVRADQPRTQPQKCAPVTDATIGNVFAAKALDGVVSYQGGSMDFATGLLSHRFATVADARAEFVRIETAARICAGTELDISEPWDIRLRMDRLDSTVPGAQQVVDVMLQPPDQVRDHTRGTSASTMTYRPSYELTVARYKNVLSWQYSYRSGPGQPTPDHRLLDTLSRRLVTVDQGG